MSYMAKDDSTLLSDATNCRRSARMSLQFVKDKTGKKMSSSRAVLPNLSHPKRTKTAPSNVPSTPLKFGKRTVLRFGSEFRHKRSCSAVNFAQYKFGASTVPKLIMNSDSVRESVAKKTEQIQFVNEGLIGRGSFSYVYKIRKTTTNKAYALKQTITPITITHNGGKEKPNVNNTPSLSEIAILNKLQTLKGSPYFHPNLCKLRLFFFSNTLLHQIYELYPHGNLKQFVAFQSSALNSLQILQVLLQIVNGLCYIHFRSLIHCDLKPENVFVHRCTEQIYLLKIGDFGISVDIENNTRKHQNILRVPSGDSRYIAPEVLNIIGNVHKLSHSTSLQTIDVYALALMVIELLFDHELPSQGSTFSYLRNIAKNESIQWDLFGDTATAKSGDHTASIIKGLVSAMLCKDSKHRISSKRLAIKLNACFDTRVKQESVIQFAKLRLPPEYSNANGASQDTAFVCCDKDQINKIPFTVKPKPTKRAPKKNDFYRSNTFSARDYGSIHFAID